MTTKPHPRIPSYFEFVGLKNGPKLYKYLHQLSYRWTWLKGKFTAKVQTLFLFQRQLLFSTNWTHRHVHGENQDQLSLPVLPFS